MGNSVARSFKNTLRAIHENTFYINDEKRAQAIKELDHLKQTISGDSIDEVKEVAKKSLPSQQDIVKVFEVFNEFAKANDLNNDFAFIFVAKHYESNYAKLMNEEIYIEFNKDRVIQLKDALSVEAIDASDEEKTGYYYIYTSKHNIDVLKSKKIDIASELLSFISQNWNKKR